MIAVYAAFFSALAFLSGIVVIGDGRHFQFTKRDILRGRTNALLYIWIAVSTMLCMIHLTMLVGYVLINNFGYLNPADRIWFVIHGAFGVVFLAAHLYIRRELSLGSVSPARYLWGKFSVT